MTHCRYKISLAIKTKSMQFNIRFQMRTSDIKIRKFVWIRFLLCQISNAKRLNATKTKPWNGSTHKTQASICTFLKQFTQRSVEIHLCILSKFWENPCIFTLKISTIVCTKQGKFTFYFFTFRSLINWSIINEQFNRNFMFRTRKTKSERRRSANWCIPYDKCMRERGSTFRSFVLHTP